MTLSVQKRTLASVTPKELRQLRLSRGWTQQELADRLGVGRLYIVRREGGLRPISLMMQVAVRCLAFHSAR